MTKYGIGKIILKLPPFWKSNEELPRTGNLKMKTKTKTQTNTS